jgi:hypothetical protein
LVLDALHHTRAGIDTATTSESQSQGTYTWKNNRMSCAAVDFAEAGESDTSEEEGKAEAAEVTEDPLVR